MRRMLLTLSLSLVLAACGGDGEGNNGANNNNATSNSTTGANTGANVSTPNGTPNSTTNNSLAALEFRPESPDEYTKLDAVGQPLVATIFVPEESRIDYNAQLPDNSDYEDTIIGVVADWHSAVDDELAAFALPPCGMPACMNQDIGNGVTPLSLLRPDALRILDSSAEAGFPNGRTLSDPVHDVWFSILLLDQTVASPDTLVGLLNPATNDVAGGEFLEEFPYLQPPHE